MNGVLITASVGASVAAYWAGRVRLGHRLLSWAEDRSYGPHTPGWWVAQVVGLVALLWVLTVHPRRSAANRRAWREARDVRRGPAIEIPHRRRAPAPQFDPDWAAKRSADRSGDAP